MLLGEKNALRNRDLHIGNVLKKQGDPPQKQDIQTQKQDIGIPSAVKPKTKSHIEALFQAFGAETVFGRADVMNRLNLTASPASALLKRMLRMGLIEAVAGHGKGKYVFCGRQDGI